MLANKPIFLPPILGQKIYLFLGYGPVTKRIMKQLIVNENPIIYLVTDRVTSDILLPNVTVWKPSEAANIASKVEFDSAVISWRSFNSTTTFNRKEFLAELALTNKNIQIVNLSTVAVYGNKNRVHDENSEVNPINQYGREKLEIEKYLEELGVSTVQNLRIANVFGDFELNDVINRIIRAIVNKFPILLTEPNIVYRDFIHIDTVTAFVCDLIRTRPFTNFETVIVATGKSTSLSEIVEICSTVLSSHLSYNIINLQPNEIQISKLNVEKFKSKFKNHDFSFDIQLKEYIHSFTM